jgi:hypothetical protein
MVTASSLAGSASSGRPSPASRSDRSFSAPGEAADGVRLSADRGRPVVGDSLTGEGGSKRGELHAVLGHLASEHGGQTGLGCQLQRETCQIGQPGVVGGDHQVDDPGECRAEQLVESRPDGRLVRRAAGQFGEHLGE